MGVLLGLLLAPAVAVVGPDRRPAPTAVMGERLRASSHAVADERILLPVERVLARHRGDAAALDVRRLSRLSRVVHRASRRAPVVHRAVARGCRERPAAPQARTLRHRRSRGTQERASA